MNRSGRTSALKPASPGIVHWQRLPACARLADTFPRRRHAVLLRGVGWILEVAQHHDRRFVIQDELPLERARIVLYEFTSREARARWVGARLDAFETVGWNVDGPAISEQIAAARRWIGQELPLRYRRAA